MGTLTHYTTGGPSCIAVAGATRAALRAGNHADTSPVIVSRNALTRRIRGSDGLTSKTSDDSHRPSTKAPAVPATRPIPSTAAACRNTNARTWAAVRAERHPDPDLLRALAHRVREHAVQTDGREHQRHACKGAHQDERESLDGSLPRPTTSVIGCRAIHDQFRIDRRDRRRARPGAICSGGSRRRRRPVSTPSSGCSAN